MEKKAISNLKNFVNTKLLTIILDHKTFNIQPGFEHFIPVPARFI